MISEAFLLSLLAGSATAIGGIAVVLLGKIRKSVEYTSKVRTPKDKYRAGTSAHITDHVKYYFEITESLENKKITFRSSIGGGKIDHDFNTYLETHRGGN